MKRRPIVPLIAVLALALASPLLAQQGKPLENKILRSLTDPSLSSPARMTEFQTILEASREESKVAIEFGFKTKKNPRNLNLRSAFKLEGPIGKDDAEASLASLKGLSDNVKVSYALSVMSPDPKQAFAAIAPANFHNLLCDAYEAEGKVASRAECATKGLFLDELSSKGERTILKGMGLGRGIKIFSVEMTYAAPEKFEYVTTESLEKQTEEHDGFAVAAAFGKLPLSSGIYYTGFSYRYEKGHKAGKKQEICQPFGTDLGALSCSELVVGAPTESTKEIGSAELRKYFREGSLAVNPRYSYDFKNDVTGIELPFYFLKDGSGNLNGGITAGWRSDTDDFTLSAFVGTMKSPF